MRALFLVHNLPERGSYFRARELAVRLAARGHEVHLVMTSEHRRHRAVTEVVPTHLPGVTLVESQSPNRTLFNDKQEGYGIPDNLWRVRHALASRWDLVYAFSHKPNCLLPGLAARSRGARLVVDWADWWGGPEGLYQSCVVNADFFQAMPRPIRAWRRATFAVDGWLEPRAVAAADAVTLISEEYFQHPLAPDTMAQKALVLHSGAPLDRIVPQPAAKARAALGLDFKGDDVVFGYVANFHTDEDLLLAGFARLVERCPKARLLVVGADFCRMTPAIQAAGNVDVSGCGGCVAAALNKRSPQPREVPSQVKRLRGSWSAPCGLRRGRDRPPVASLRVREIVRRNARSLRRRHGPRSRRTRTLAVPRRRNPRGRRNLFRLGRSRPTPVQLLGRTPRPEGVNPTRRCRSSLSFSSHAPSSPLLPYAFTRSATASTPSAKSPR
jgi:hypothetical protein